MWGPRAANPWLSVMFEAVSAQLGAPGVTVTEVPTPLRDASFDAWLARTSALAGPLAKRLTALPDHARDQLRARLAEAVRPYQTPAGLDFPGVSLVAAGRHPARFTA